jgi:hypothetical protein
LVFTSPHTEVTTMTCPLWIGPGALVWVLCAAAQPETLRGQLCDEAGLRAVVKSCAVQEARRILETARIRAAWTEIDPPQRDAPFNPERRQADVFVRILPKDVAERLAPRGSVFGVAAPVGAGHFRWLASVFPHRAAELGQDTGIEVGLLLGHFIAHEIGHLLPGSNTHAASGIMSSPWGTAGMTEAARGRLLFSKSQASRMSANVRVRLESECLMRTATDSHRRATP